MSTRTHRSGTPRRLPNHIGPPDNPNAFEQFTATSERHVGIPFVSINSSRSNAASLGLSTTFMACYGADARYAQLFYSRQDRVIAIRIGKRRAGRPVSSFMITLNRRSGSAVISSTAGFFQHFDLDPGQYVGRYVPRQVAAREVGIDHDGDVFVLDLKQPLRKGPNSTPGPGHLVMSQRAARPAADSSLGPNARGTEP